MFSLLRTVVPKFKQFSADRKATLIRVAKTLVVVCFLILVARFYLPGKGMTALIGFGENFENQYIPELKNLPHYSERDSFGYDGQWYAQIAIRPDPTDPEMIPAVDNLPYRTRRILFCWTAYLLGLGKPAYILQVFALQNIIGWLLLALLMQRWFPATTFDHLFRWAAVLLSYGLCASVHYSLTDGPSLLLIAVGVALIEAGKPWRAALVLGVSSLGKETNILGSAGIVRPDYRTLKEWFSAAVRVAITVAPLLIWTYYIFRVHGSSEAMSGSRNFAPPFVAISQKIHFTISWLLEGGNDARYARGTLYVMVALVTQFLLLVLRPQPSQPWWRVAIGYCVLMVFLGEAVWEGYPGAASRVLLPMTLAFNVLVPRGKFWWIVLLLGNASIFASSDLARPPAGNGYKLVESPGVAKIAGSKPALRVDFTSGWYPAERSQFEHWRWTQQRAEMSIFNSTNEPIVLNVEFEAAALSPRMVRFAGEKGEFLSVEVSRKKKSVRAYEILINPGENKLWWETEGALDRSANPADTREFGFRIYNLKLEAKEETR